MCEEPIYMYNPSFFVYIQHLYMDKQTLKSWN